MSVFSVVCYSFKTHLQFIVFKQIKISQFFFSQPEEFKNRGIFGKCGIDQGEVWNMKKNQFPCILSSMQPENHVKNCRKFAKFFPLFPWFFILFKFYCNLLFLNRLKSAHSFLVCRKNLKTAEFSENAEIARVKYGE